MSIVPHPGHHEPEDRWSDGSTSAGGKVSSIGWLHPRRRAMRLAAAIGVVLGVLCIVLGTLALVVELGPRHPAKPRRMAHTYRGPGNEGPKRIGVPATGHFEVDWSFSCPLGRTGTFKLADSPAAADVHPDVNKSGASESGRWPDVGDGRPTLVVISSCSWHARVVPKATSGPSHGGNHQHGTLATHPHSNQHGYDKPWHKKAHHHRQKHSPAPAE